MRLFSRSLALFAFAVASVFGVDRPNIVYILADDLGYGDVQGLNPQRGKIPTPHLDRLAQQGMTFTDAHSGASVCTPTRYGLLTGRYAWRTRLQQGVLDGGSDAPLIAADRLTVPALLRAQGYATACIGKWHLGFLADAAPPTNGTKRGIGDAGPPLGSRIVGGPITRGFDYFWGCSNARTMTSLIEDDRVIEKLPPVEMLPRLTQRTVDYLGAQAAAAKSGRPFFLYVALTSPHTPILPAAEWKGKSPLGAYGDFVLQTDDAVGRILAALDRHGLADNTLVVFTSDNGCAVQASVEKLEAAGHFASAQHRGYKADSWEGGHRVPFFVRWPGRVQPGARSDALIGLGDFMATTADMLGVRLPDSAAPDSVSFLPVLRGASHSPARGALVHHSIKGDFAIREGRWKLILGGGSGGYGKPGNDEAAAQGLPDAQLYDLAADAGETKNLIARHRAEAARLAALLQRIVAQGRSTPGLAQVNDTLVKLPAPAALAANSAPADRPRLAILTDIGGDPDDQQAMIRLMLYTNELDLELLIASAVRTNHAPAGPTTRPDLIRQIVDAYGEVLPNLKRRASAWPTVEELRARILPGNPRYGRQHVGEGHDTVASRALIARIDAGAPERPLNLSIWGGQTDLAQALWRVKHDRGPTGWAEFVRKVRIYDIADQDEIADWMRAEFAGLFYILAKAPPGRDKREGVFRGVYLTGDESLTSRAWVEQHVLSCGPLGALYPVKTHTVPNPHGCLKEGDTPSWFFFLPLGGNDPRDPSKPGWGGQYERQPDGWYQDFPARPGFDPRVTVSQWRPDFQRDFARRLTWCLPEK